MSTPTTTTTATPPTSGSGRMPLAAKIVVFALLPVMLIGTLAAVFGIGILRGVGPVQLSESSPAASSVLIDMENAEIVVVPSTDANVHATLEGTYFGREPQLRAENLGDVTRIEGGCARFGFLGPCSVVLTVSLPADLPLEINGMNGRISIDQITGPISIGTTNGSITVTGASGALELRTNNGAVMVRQSTSTELDVSTTNGNVELELADAPTAATAKTTNGSILLQLPAANVRYNLSTDTVNGNVDTGGVTVDSSSDRRVTLTTTNGSVTVRAIG